MVSKSKGYINLIKKYLLPLWPRLIVLFIFMIFGIGLNLILPQILRYYIDNVNNNMGSNIMYIISGAYLLTVALRLIVSTLNVYVSENLGWIASNKLRIDLTRHCIDLDMDFHKSHNAGEMVERIDGDVSFLANFLSIFVVNFIGNTVLIIGILIMLSLESWLLGVALGVLSIVIVYSLSLLQKIVTPYWVKVREKSAELFGYIEEHLHGKEDICALGAEEYTENELDTCLKGYKNEFRKANFVSNFTSLSVFSLFNVGDALSLGLGAYLFLKGSVSLGTVYLVFNYAGLLYKPLEDIRNQYMDLQKIGASVERINNLFNIKSNIVDGNEIINENEPVSIKVENLRFEYRKNEKVLDGISFDLEKNKILGLVGRTGSGKTTLAQLLIRIYEPTGGVIKINGKDIKEYKLSSFRERIGMITQNVQIFNATIRDNITLFSNEIDDEKIISAIKQLELEEWFERMPKGLDTHICPDELSAGEAQLLAFTRIFLRDPRVIIFDEATSYIDPHTANLIQNTMKRVLKNRTVIMIAHRLNTLAIADYILVLEKGKIKEFGEREVLERDSNSEYYKLLNMEKLEMLN